MKTLTILVVILGYTTLALSQSNDQMLPDSLAYCVTKSNVGLGGYDALSYFQSDKPKMGKPGISASYEQVTYYFSSESNKNEFLKNPDRYLPRYGGWCSMTLSMGRATKPVYDNFVIDENRLYLFERTLSVNGKELWLRDVSTNRNRASENYRQYKATGKIQ